MYVNHFNVIPVVCISKYLPIVLCFYCIVNLRSEASLKFIRYTLYIFFICSYYASNVNRLVRRLVHRVSGLFVSRTLTPPFRPANRKYLSACYATWGLFGLIIVNCNDNNHIATTLTRFSHPGIFRY